MLKLKDNPLYNTLSPKQDLSIARFQVSLINSGNFIDPKDYAEHYHLINQKGEFNYLGNLLADDNDISIRFINKNLSEDLEIGQRNIIEAYFVIHNFIKLELELDDDSINAVDNFLKLVFISNDWTKTGLKFEITIDSLKAYGHFVAANELLINIFDAYKVEMNINHKTKRIIREDNVLMYRIKAYE